MADERAQKICENIAYQLEQNANAIRIKKLTLYACKDWWENDLDTLNVTDLKKLVQELRRLNPTLDQLQTRLKTLVKTLNKKEEYFQVAHLILEKMEELYSATSPFSGGAVALEDVTAIVVSPPKINPLIVEIANKLEQDIHLVRIKKLMLNTARKYWETDPLKIDHAQLQDLIDELWQGYPTLESLSASLAAIVKTLNKPVEYALIAETVLREMARLYSVQADAPPRCEPLTPTELLPPQELPQLDSQLKAIEPSEPINLFDVRLEMIKYANPLRAKILLFSIVYYPFTSQSQDWSNLKLYSLDGLLRSLTTVCHSFEELQAQVHETAQRLNEPDEYADVAAVLLKCLKLVYPKLQQHVQQALQSGSVADTTRASTTQIVKG